MQKLNTLQRNYVSLLIREGVNLQPGQRLVISADVDQAWFARLCAKEAYQAGCREVVMNWNDDVLARMKYLYADDSVFDTFAPWKSLLYNSMAEEGAAWLLIESSDPENLKGVDPERIQKAQISSGNALVTFRRLETNNGFPWCIAAIPSPSWAKRVFPELAETDAVDQLWKAILQSAHSYEGNAVDNWRAHSQELQKRVSVLNEYQFQSLHYQNSLGTDLTVELPEGHFWAGGAEKCTSNGKMFSANIPTEEVFTVPKRNGIHGTVVASKPLSNNGNIISGFRFRLENGKIVELHADVGEEYLRKAIQVDEGASYFGEVALVPYDSPISNSGILFYNTLFDENASCHFAFGDAYPCIQGAETMNEEELLAHGVNHSMTHVDFMVGTPDLTITGVTREGKNVPVFLNGNFVF